MGILDFFKKKSESESKVTLQSSSTRQVKNPEKATSTINGTTIAFDDKTKENLQIDQQALTAYENRDYQKAVELYTKLIEANPNAHQYFQFRGTVYEDMGNDVLAQKDFENSVELSPENSTSLYRLAMIYHRKNNLEKAIFYLRRAYNLLSKTDEKLGKEFGYKNLMGNSYNNILMVHKRVIAFNLANFLVQTNRTEEGLLILDELIKYCPTYSYPYFVKAMVCAQNKDVEQGIELAQKAVLYGHPQAQSLLVQLKSFKRKDDSSDDRFTQMVNNASFNPFKITCNPRLQNTQSVPNLVSVFTKELNDLYRILNGSGEATHKNLVQMASGYVFNLVESYYDNAGYVPKNSLDQIIEQVYNAMQQSGFRNAFPSLDDFKYYNYYGFLNH